VDPKAGRELRTITAGVEPLGIALTPDQKTLLVTSSATGEVLGFHAETLSQLFAVSVGKTWPVAVAAHPDGKRAFISHLHGDRVDVLDLEQHKIVGALKLATKDTGLPGRLGNRFQTGRVPNQARALVVSPGGTRLFVAHTMVNTGAARSAGVIRGGYGMGADSPIVATVSTFDLETGELIRPKVTFTKQRRNNDVHTDHANMQVLQQPIALAHDPRHARLLMAAHGADRVAALDTRWTDPVTKPMGAWTVGHAPKGIALSADGKTAFVHNAHNHDVSVLDLSGKVGGANHNQRWAAPTLERVAFGKSPLPADAVQGRRLFTFALDARISGANRFACASCHPDGRTDGLTWQVGAGPRQTPILADRLHQTAPFNWLGTEDKLEDNITQTIRRLGGSAIKDDERAALASYMTRYMDAPDNPSRDARGTEIVMLGRTLFHNAEVGCSTCHDSDSRFTDGARHEVGTTSKIEFELWKRFGRPTKGNTPGGPPAQQAPISGPQMNNDMRMEMPINGLNMPMTEPIPEAPVAFNTPSLRHIWASGPYYHDGSSADLKALLTTGNKGDKMGKTSHLSTHEVDALVAYLETL
jgi:cytochrome c peroxidase/DNA-binding beta-propeller fold protein YncE